VQTFRVGALRGGRVGSSQRLRRRGAGCARGSGARAHTIGKRVYKPARPLQTGFPSSALSSFASNGKYNVVAHPKRLEVRRFM
jgi:hypothetical protein